MSFNRTLPVLPPLLPSRRHPQHLGSVNQPIAHDQHSFRSKTPSMVNESENTHLDVDMDVERREPRDSPLKIPTGVQGEQGEASSSPAQAMDVDEGTLTQPERSSSAMSSSSNVSQQYATQVVPSMSKGASGWPGEASQVCLCQPDPKIPRPRNGKLTSFIFPFASISSYGDHSLTSGFLYTAFILYRQHNQASIVAANPQLHNPEISKVIGELWQMCSPEEKAHWKALAEEEKSRHKKQYPGYRYQPKPKRLGGNGDNTSAKGARDGGGADGDAPCPRCGGRAMPTSSTAMLSGSSGGSGSGGFGMSNMHLASPPHAAVHSPPPPGQSTHYLKRSATVSGPHPAPILGSDHAQPHPSIPVHHQQGSRKYAHYPAPIQTTVAMPSPGYAPTPVVRSSGGTEYQYHHRQRSTRAAPGPQLQSPDTKRRRMIQGQQQPPPQALVHHATVPHPGIPAYGQPMPRTPYPHGAFPPPPPGSVGVGPMITPVPPGARRQSLPRADVLPYHHQHHHRGGSIISPSPTVATFAMGPPPPPAAVGTNAHASSGQRGSIVSAASGGERVTLPPLQLASPRQGSHHPSAAPLNSPPPPMTAIRTTGERASSSATAAPTSGATIPILKKLNTLASLTRSLSTTIEGEERKRGVIIAIEGESPQAVTQLSNALQNLLSLSTNATSGGDTNTGATVVKVFGSVDGIAERIVEGPVGWMGVVQEYHGIMKEVVQFVTAPSSEVRVAQPESMGDKPVAPQATEVGSVNDGSTSTGTGTATKAQGLDGTTIATAKDTPPLSPKTTSHLSSPSDFSSSLRIALLPTSLLSLTNLASSIEAPSRGFTIPGHWGWFASLWKGMVGADLSVVLTDSGGSGNEVEVREEVKAIFVRSGGNGDGGENGSKGLGTVGEGTVRRVGFEVGEWVRGWW